MTAIEVQGNPQTSRTRRSMGLFNNIKVGNTVLIVFVSFFGSRVHRPRCIGIGAMIASVGVFLIALPHFISEKYTYTDFTSSQLLLGIGGVPIQPFGISYIDDFAEKRNSPFYLGILFAITVIGPAFGYVMSSALLRFYVDVDKSLGFPKIVMRTLRIPIFLLVVLAQVNLAAMVAGLATFMGKFIERQFAQTASFSNLMMGGLNIPSAMLGIMAGGVILRKLGLTVKSSAAMCMVAVFLSIMFAIPLLFIGCPTQNISGINYNISSQQCSNACSCSDEAFNPVCGSDGVEFRSPCHAGCKTPIFKEKVLNYTDCECVASAGSPGFALPGPCENGCKNRLIPFMILSSITCFVASLSHTTSFMMILRTVTPEDKSFALGIQFMLFRVLAFLPAPVLYGRAIDTACIMWGKKCHKITSCRYYDLDLFRHSTMEIDVNGVEADVQSEPASSLTPTYDRVVEAKTRAMARAHSWETEVPIRGFS
ncbi:Solute carrier organic anion transporter family member [Labeo rohita]|uniref:Solute carrier organic anion transporter family member n=1 Tax=Labeo rohita TaxID=84645 RepID=A0A498LGC6_LABRO|nr:Solute carrier organic anion transporter family member [Labeo rohita]